MAGDGLCQWLPMALDQLVVLDQWWRGGDRSWCWAEWLAMGWVSGGDRVGGDSVCDLLCFFS